MQTYRPLISILLLLIFVFATLESRGDGLEISRSTPLAERPFWRRKPELLKKLRDDREVIVSVRRESIGDGDAELQRFTMNGGGYVKRPKDFCFVVSQDYEKLKDVSDHFKTVQYTVASKQLFLVTEALGWQARMILQMRPVSEDWRSELQWEVIWGHFKGMKGFIGFEKIDEKETEVSLHAKYEAKELPLPKVLMSFALEVVTKKIAEKMRAFIEAQPALAAETPTSAPAAKPLTGIGTVKLPPGFKISVFTPPLKNARSMTLSPAGTLYVGTKEEGVVYALKGAVQAAAKNQPLTEVRIIAKGLNEPNGVAFANGSLYIAEISKISRLDKIEARLANPPKPAIVRGDYPEDKWHGWKYLQMGPDGWLYVPVGAPCNLCVNAEPVYASITRLSLNGKKREIFAHGVRNSVGFDWHPKTRELWFTDNGADMMGDDIPNDELNRAPKAGLNFGYPYCHQGDTLDKKFGANRSCDEFTKPSAKLGAHTASLGMKFYRGAMFPPEYRNRIFIAQHGSWNRSSKVGYRIVTVAVNEKGQAASPEVFAEGWLQGEVSWGRPVDILNMPDGSLLVSDDEAGQIYRITYSAPPVAPGAAK